MSEISDLENRIVAAMERIGRVVEASGGPTASDTSAEDLALARSVAETAESAARMAAERADTAEAEVARLQQALEAETTAGVQLRERVGSLKSMKERQQERIHALEEQLASMTQTRASDREELDGLIAALEPLVKEPRDAWGQD